MVTDTANAAWSDYRRAHPSITPVDERGAFHAGWAAALAASPGAVVKPEPAAIQWELAQANVPPDEWDGIIEAVLRLWPGRTEAQVTAAALAAASPQVPAAADGRWAADRQEGLPMSQDETPATGVEAILAAEIHEAWEFQYDECDHGTYTGGPRHGEPYAMCELTAARIVERRKNDETHPCGHERRTRGCGGCDPGAVEFVIDDAQPYVLRRVCPSTSHQQRGEEAPEATVPGVIELSALNGQPDQRITYCQRCADGLAYVGLFVPDRP